MRQTLAAAVLLALAGAAHAQAVSPVILEPVVVSATRSETRVFDAPAAINAVGADVITVAGPQVNLSEALTRIPGIAALNRNNYAQDLQVSIRGFGSRSTFGIRGIRVIVDGIPATMPDGQGQASSISLSSAERIEVLRGPLALLYGNAAGGVLQVFTKSGAPEPDALGELHRGLLRHVPRRRGIRDDERPARLHHRRLVLPHRRLSRPQRRHARAGEREVGLAAGVRHAARPRP